MSTDERVTSVHRTLVIACDMLDEAQRRAVASASGVARVVEIDEKASAAAYASAIAGADIVIGRPPAAVLPGSGVGLLQLPRAGYDEYEGFGLEHEPGFAMCNARGVFSPCVAEHGVALLLALARRVPAHVREIDALVWRRAASYDELAGSTVCIVGLGDIGGEIARRCAGLGMTVTGVKRDTTASDPAVAQVFGADEILDAVADADHVVVALPGGVGTRHLVDARVLAAMRPGATLVNVGRGSVVDEEALVDRLEAGHLSAAALDVAEPEPPAPGSRLWGAPNLLLTPHCGGQSPRNSTRMCGLAVENVRRFLRGDELVNQVLPKPPERPRPQD